ncbi:putative outer membrane starch-binding protein [Pontibacter ummariensis]|uniref:Starch-binding associating with outer membrane n=1 Tax=Pontibacter ummariensis TaxID=1610492 RepID=A0A239G028_9BACT|nr:RagB/SusD family nutrient uptake outer membrane protein [Pontibacter ummariensis]PRY11692.1 putative outer membrane starch-binding protein [Pontibacter ummariensis]SNS62776.1 Starch-binding associating with outer membrane [Pontibacter ummariensis]
MKTRIVAAIFLSLTFFGCEKDFLDTPPIDKLTDETYWTSEENVRTFSYGFYSGYFTGYGSSYTWGDYFTGQSLNDDFAPTNPAQFTKNVPASGGGWSFGYVRKANVFIDRVQNVPMSDEAKKHWTGIGRFFRAMEYADLVNSFGDVPWYETELLETDMAQLYKPRDSRTFVMDKVLADFKYAAENVRVSDGAKGLSVNRDVVLAYMSRVFLFEGTWQKYHANNATKAAAYLEAAKWAADQVISSGRYSLGNYREVFSSLSLASNPEVILFRQYEPGILTHSLNSYNNKEAQTGPSKDAVETYLAKDGLPITVSALYEGDQGVAKLMANRDPRMTATFVPSELRLNGIASNYSTSGFATHKFLNESIKDIPEGSSNLNPTDAPVIRYGEVLMNYAEAAAELATVGGPAFTQEDLDKSINVLRARPGIGMPALQVSGDQVAVNGVAYNDPERDPSVPSVIWEIRRERRVELMMEGFRLDDLRRWRKLEYTDTQANPDINRGAWIKKADHPKLNASVVLTDGDEGYIIPSTKAESQRLFTDPKVYLNPLPLDQIKLYKDAGKELTQNPGWE